ncbi:hypothetical protein, partial [Oleiphilus sp. HI0066]|uniref:hypothetical protein n=4 Tax=unclassified Oleiphilus TaxID=2631174 RepID=UPI000A897D2E
IEYGEDLPEWDGRFYNGAISFVVSEEGLIHGLKFKKRSGYKELDDYMYNALQSAKKFEMPSDETAALFVRLQRLKLDYSHEDTKGFK